MTPIISTERFERVTELRDFELRRLKIMDSRAEQAFDDIVHLVAEICETPIALVSLLDSKRQWFKAKVGVEICETLLADSVCRIAIEQKNLFEIEDLRTDPRFCESKLVKGEPRAVFYAGMPLVSGGETLGTLCVIDCVPRKLDPTQRHTLEVMAGQVMRLIERHAQALELNAARTSIELLTNGELNVNHAVSFSTASMPVGTTYMDTDLRFRYANEAYQKEFGVKIDQLVGRRLTEVFRRDHAELAEENLRKALAGELSSIEKFYYHPSGDRFVRINYLQDIDAEGKVRGVVCHFQDITEQRKIERQLAETQARRDWILSEADVATFDWDCVNNIVIGNPRLNRLFGVPEDADGLPREAYFRAIHPDDLPKTLQASLDATKNSTKYEAQYRVRLADGSTRVVMSRGETIHDASGKPIRLTGVAIDITDRVQAEEELRENKNLLASMFRVAQIGMWHYDCATGWIEYDDIVADNLGFDPPVAGLMTAHEYNQFIFAEDFPQAQAVFNRAEETGEQYEVEYRISSPTGTRYILERATSVKDSSGAVTHLRGVVLNISPQKEVAERERSRLHELLNLSPAYMALKEGPDLRITYANAAFYQQVGNRELIGRPIAECLPEMLPQGHIQAQEMVYKTGIPQSGEELSVMVQRTPDGPLVQTYVNVVHQAVRDESGRITGVFTHGYDVSEAVESRRARAETEELFRTVFDAAGDDAIVLTDINGAVLAWNPAAERITGWSSEEVKGELIDILLPTTSREAGSQRRLFSLAQEYGKTGIERWHMRRDGTRFWASGSLNCLQDAHGNVRGYLKLFRDATERYETERRVRDLNEQLELKVIERTDKLAQSVKEAHAFNYALSHDLRSPVRAIAGTAAILIEEAAPCLSEEHLDLLRRQETNAKRLGELTDELLRLSRLTHVEINRAPLDLSALTFAVVSELNPKQTISVEPNLKGIGDEKLLRTVLDNLIGNACKFSPPEAVVRVGQDEQGFYVRDEGVGFDMEYAQRIFLPFERLVTQDEFPGTGIGLANVERIIRRHGGRVWVESEVGQGSTFHFTLA